MAGHPQGTRPICGTIIVALHSTAFVRNEHPMAMLLGRVRVRRVRYLASVPIKPAQTCAIVLIKIDS